MEALIFEALEIEVNALPVPGNSKHVKQAIHESRTRSLADLEQALGEPGYKVTDIYVQGDMQDVDPF